jgi:transposase
MSQVTVMTGPHRRRRWTREERREILKASFAPGAVVAGVARQYEISTSLIYKWRSEVRPTQSDTTFVPAMVSDAGQPARIDACSGLQAAIVVELSGGGRVLIDANASVSIVTAALKALQS